MMALRGNPSFSFGSYEWAKTIHWSTFITAIVIAVISWVLCTIIPAWQNEGGTVAMWAAVLTPVLKGLLQGLQDNTDKVHE